MPSTKRDLVERVAELEDVIEQFQNLSAQALDADEDTVDEDE